MEHTEEFLNNNICALHISIRRKIQKAKDNIRYGEYDEALETLTSAVEDVNRAYDRGNIMEARLKLYRKTIEGLGFVRRR